MIGRRLPSTDWLHVAARPLLLGRARELKTWVSAETGPEATIEALMSVVAYFRLPLARAKAILGDVERAVKGWRRVGRSLGMSTREMEGFADAFEHPERQQARKHAEIGRAHV